MRILASKQQGAGIAQVMHSKKGRRRPFKPPGIPGGFCNMHTIDKAHH